MIQKTIAVTAIIILCLTPGCRQKNNEHQANNSHNDKKGIINESFNIFWNKFRGYCLTKNFDALTPLVEFPVITRGPLDYHPEIKFKKSSFKKLFSLFLLQPTGMDLKLEETVLDDIKQKKIIIFSDTKDPIISGEWARVNDMQFKKINSQWKLFFLYLNKKTYAELGIDIEE